MASARSWEKLRRFLSTDIPACLSSVPSSALRQPLHSRAMRRPTRLEYEPAYYASWYLSFRQSPKWLRRQCDRHTVQRSALGNLFGSMWVNPSRGRPLAPSGWRRSPPFGRSAQMERVPTGGQSPFAGRAQSFLELRWMNINEARRNRNSNAL